MPVRSRALQIQHPEHSAVMLDIKTPVFRIGRAEDNDLVLNDRGVSRWHAKIVNSDDGPALLQDLNSANGTQVNGERLTAPLALRTHDQITIGQFVMQFREEQHHSESFTIEAGAVNLADVQQDPQLLVVASKSAKLSPAGELQNLELLFESGMALARSQSVGDVAAIAVELLFKIEQVHRATVMLWDEERNAFAHSELHFRGGSSVAPEEAPYDPRALVMSKTIMNRVRQENRPLLIRDTKADDLTTALSIVRAGIQAALCSPLTCQDRFLGLLYADNLEEPEAFSDTDFRIFTAIAAQAGLALGNAIANRELVRREVQRQALKAYLPPQVADLILASDGDLDLSGKLQQVTVLFADIRGFTRMSERMDAREVVGMLNEFFSHMSDAIFRHQGTVDKFIGDCIMALFGAPLAAAESADRALDAALEMQRAAAALNTKRVERGLKEMRIGIGLHTGPAVVGNIGSADRVQYTAIGDTVNVASRLVSRAEPDQIIVSEDFRAALSNVECLNYIGEAELKGRETKLKIYSAEWRLLTRQAV